LATAAEEPPQIGPLQPVKKDHSLCSWCALLGDSVPSWGLNLPPEGIKPNSDQFTEGLIPPG
jgi:hypothetical protein